MRIVAMVPNSGARDVRVVKEARTLVEAGHSVDVIGIREPNHTSIAAILQEKLIVHRISWQTAAFQRTTVILLLGTFFMSILGLFFLFQFFQLAGFLNAQLGITHNLATMWRGIISPVQSFWADNDLLSNLYLGHVDKISWIGGLTLFFGFLFSFAIVLASLWLFWRYLWPVLFKAARKLWSALNFFFTPAKNFSNFALNYADDEKVNLGSSQFLFEMVANEGMLSFVANQLRKFASLIHYRSVHLKQTKGMTELALELKPDLIYCHEVQTLKAGVAVKNKLGIPLIYDAHEMYDELVQGAPHILKRYKILHEKYLSQVDAFVTVNETIADIYNTVYPDIKETVIIKNATPHATLRPYDGRLHDAAKLPYGRKILLYQGGYAPSRGIEGLVKAAPYLPDDWSVVLMGWGRLQEDLETLIAEQAEEWSQKNIDNLIDELKRKSRDKITSEARDILLSLSPAGDTEELEKNIRAIYNKDLSRDDLLSAQEENISHQLLLGTSPQWSDRSLTKQFEFDNDDSENTLTNSLSVRNRLVQRYINKVTNTLTRWDKAGSDLRSEIEIGILKKILLENIPRLEPEGYDKVRMIPPAVQEQLPLWSQGATLGAIPYPNDGLNHWACSPNKLWEYPNANVPILASPVPELYKTVNEHGIGWILPPDPSAQQIAMIIQDLSDEQLAHAKENCKAFIAKDNWSVYAERLIDVVERVGKAA